jgi:hypothetical protein
MLQEVDGVQFFVGNDGSVGMSQRGLARLAGIHESTAKRDIEAILHRLYPSGKLNPESAEAYTVKGIEGGSNWTKIYDAEVCVAVIEYKAFDSGRKNATAINSYRKFAKVGFTKWVQDVTGYAAANNEALLAQTLAQVLDSVQRLEVDMKEMQGETKRFRTIIKRSVGDLPGLSILISSIETDEDTKRLESVETFTLPEWLFLTKGVVLSRGGTISMGNLTAALYKGHKQADPMRESRYQRENSEQNTKKVSGIRTVYTQEDFAFLEMAWQKYNASKLGVIPSKIAA